MYKTITSSQNPIIKNIQLLDSKSRERRKQGLFVVEGKREISMAFKGGYQFQTILFCPEIFPETTFSKFVKKVYPKPECIALSSDLYKKIAYRSSTEGIIGIAKTKSLHLDDIQFSKKNPLILVAEAPEKPGNIGALLRTADAAKLDAVIIANPKTDMYNPNIIRSSLGCVFTNAIASGTTDEIILFLKRNNISIYCAALQGSVSYHLADYTQSTAIVVGTEATGLSENWLAESTKNILIPMQGEIDSMNVSVAAGILIFEAKRQRNFL